MKRADPSCKRSFMKSFADVRKKANNGKTAILVGMVICILTFGMFLGSAKAATINIALENQTGLDSGQYTIYALGYSVASWQMLLNDGTFGPIPSGSGTIESYPVGSGLLSQISIDESTSLTGARVYFFVAGAGQPAPTMSYNNGAVIQIDNPPNANYPPYSFIEITQNPSYSSTPVIDVQTVDGFIFPLTISLNGGQQVGQPSPAGAINRVSIFKAYKNFMNAQGDAGQPYKKLQFTNAGGGLLNPYFYLTETDSNNQFLNLTSPLNTVFDNALKKLFSNGHLSLQGVVGGSIPADVYTVVSTGPQSYPGSDFTIPALQFKGQTYGNTFNVFNPAGMTVTLNPKNGKPITGTINGTSLTFDKPVAKKALAPGMFVQGVGTNTTTKIQSLVTQKNGIGGVVLNQDLGVPGLQHTQYVFSKVPGLFYSSGAMVFGNEGVFADGAAQFPSDSASSTVLENLENQIVTALNRGVATLGPASGNPGYTSAYWFTETNWYPAGKPQNLFSLFMHTGKIAKVGIFTQPSPAAKNARGQLMGQAYGFAFDESPAVVSGLSTQPPVPSKFDPAPAGTTAITVTLGPWE